MEQSDHNKDNKLDFDGIKVSFEFQGFKRIVALENFNHIFRMGGNAQGSRSVDF